MIPIYTKDEHNEEFQKLEGRLGAFTLDYLYQIVREINKHIADEERHNVPCDEEEGDAGESTEADRSDKRLPRTEPGERSA